MALQIPCPQCAAELKLRDRSLLGKTGKCPKCGHRFTLAEPAEVELELATPKSDLPIPVARARRVTETPQPASVDPVSKPSASASLPTFVDTPLSLPPAADLGRLPPRGPSRRSQIIIGALIAVVGVGLAAIVWNHGEPDRTRTSVTRRPAAPNPELASERDRLRRIATLVEADSPTHGRPITFDYVPAGASIIIHVHPAALWRAGSTAEETRFCLGEDFTNWCERQIRDYCLLDPAEIEEATICLFLGARGTAPEVTTVVRPTTALKRSQLIEKFQARLPGPGEAVYVGDQRAFVIGKEETADKRPLLFATAPAAMASELAQSLDDPGVASDEIRRVLEKSDRERHLTLAFRPAEIRIHRDSLVRIDLAPLIDSTLDLLGDDVQSAMWSLHLAGDALISEAILRNDPATQVTRLQTQLAKTLAELPGRLLAAVTRMSPENTGSRKIVGRLPAMCELLAASTVSGIGDRYVVFQSRLPDRAAPNLALASVLTWNESSRLGATISASSTANAVERTSGTLVERLDKVIEIDFRQTPLEEAFAYLDGETGVSFEIDGDALKLAGYTRNMPQTFSLGRVPARQAIAQMLQAPQDKLAVVLDDANLKAIVTTKSVAAEKRLVPAEFAP